MKDESTDLLIYVILFIMTIMLTAILYKLNEIVEHLNL